MIKVGVAFVAPKVRHKHLRGELNPDVWPPIVDEDRFDLALDDDPATEVEDVPIPAGATIDDLD